MTVADILQQMAETAGNARRSQGSILGNTIENLSNLPGQIANEHERQQWIQDQRRRQLAADQRAAANDARQTQNDARDEKARVAKDEYDGIVNAGLTAAIGDSGDPYHFDAKAAFAKVSELGKPDAIRDVIAKHQQLQQKPLILKPGDVGVDPTTNQPIPGMSAPKDPKSMTPTDLAVLGMNANPVVSAFGRGALNLSRAPATSVPTLGSPADAVTRYATEHGLDPKTMTTAQVNAALKQHTDATQKTPPAPSLDAVNNVRDAVAGMKDGTLPPQMPGRASKDYTAILAEARRQGFNLGQANLDWNATQKHVATMNGAQQLRLNQAINSLPDMLDKVDALASQWKGGRFPILNKANLALAKGGTYGSDVASIANQLDAQIADVTADLGNVYMGGNSPTDHALGLAGKSLKGEWDEKVLHDMVKLAKTNVTIRSNSIKHTGVAGASDTNPYGNQPPVQPATPTPAGMMRVVGPNGETGSMPIGNALPPGWKKQ